ncbi:MAG TPA: ClpP-like prohead protease/major capsid protein fusion protein [Thiohalobacter sp.]|nr:ClpP-like prohead protease/major capsid protein fusion protein [Thiohalobacter sp.]
MIEIYFYSDIGEGLARDIADQLDQAKGQDVLLRINSPGGSVSEALGVVSAMRRHGRVDTAVDGLAASAASVISVSGRRRTIAENALIMVHAPWVVTEGNAEELRRTADVVEKHGDQLLDIYARATGMPRATVQKWLAAETWFDSAEALDASLVDEIDEPLAVAASMRRQIHTMGFSRPPKSEESDMPTPKTTKADDKPDLTAVDRDSVLARERQRRSSIRTAYEPYMDREGVRALYDAVADDPDITLQSARDKLLHKLGETAEPVASIPRLSLGENRHHSDFKAAAVDALLLRGGIKIKDPHPAAQDFRGYSIIDMARARLSQIGKSTTGMSRADTIQAALTASDLPDLLANVASKSVVSGFNAEHAVTHGEWTMESTLPDFKEAKRVALSEAPGLLEVQERGEFLDGSLSDAAESIQLKTYGRIISLSRQMLINDDFGELTRVPEAMGMAARRTESDIVYSLLTSNPTMRDSKTLFHDDHDNYVANGSGKPPSVAALGEARAAMKLQKGLQGESFLNIEPRYLLVPVALETVAFALMASIVPLSVDEVVPEWIKNLTVISDPRLDESSTTGWYLAADAQLHSTIDVARLDGEPVFLDTQNGFSTDDVRMKVRIDTGAAAVDWRGLYFNYGA